MNGSQIHNVEKIKHISFCRTEGLLIETLWIHLVITLSYKEILHQGWYPANIEEVGGWRIEIDKTRKTFLGEHSITPLYILTLLIYLIASYHEKFNFSVFLDA